MRALLLQALVILALAATATVLTWKFHPRAPALYLQQDALAEGEISIGKALEWEEAGGVIWLDARAEAKFAAGHIPGAILLNEFDFNQQLMESFHLVANQDQPLVVYCGSHSCKASTKIANELRDKGFNDVYVLKGGWDAWREAKGSP